MWYFEALWMVLFFFVVLILIKDINKYINKRGESLEIEQGESPVVHIRCGGIFDSISYTYPFVKLKLYKDFLVVVFEGRLSLRYDEIEYISLYKFLVINYIKIVHHNKGLPANILLSTFSVQLVEDYLKNKVVLK